MGARQAAPDPPPPGTGGRVSPEGLGPGGQGAELLPSCSHRYHSSWARAGSARRAVTAPTAPLICQPRTGRNNRVRPWSWTCAPLVYRPAGRPHIRRWGGRGKGNIGKCVKFKVLAAWELPLTIPKWAPQTALFHPISVR